MTMHPFSRNAVASFDWGGVMMNKYFSKDNKSRHQRYTSDVLDGFGYHEPGSYPMYRHLSE